GGASTGGRITGGASTGGRITGGASTGGRITGGGSTGGTITGGVEAMMVVFIELVQVTVAPPPLPEPLHWLMVMGSAADIVFDPTVHWTRIVPPPPLPESLHWVTVAFVVEPIGVQTTVGSVPPFWPEALHWFTDPAAVSAVPVMMFSTVTLHCTAPPPPLPEPLH
ncbi:hypothetical protein IWX65_003583, partial [Arthrobacter sp. CAN_A214]